MSVPQFIIDLEDLEHFEAGIVTLEGHEFHHFRVRRVRVGDEVLVSNGHGITRRGTVVEIGPDKASIQVLPELPTSGQATSPRLTLAIALLKGRRLADAVEKMTELGVGQIILFHSRHTIRDPSASTLARLRRVAIAAAKQSERSMVPPIHACISFSDMIQHASQERRLLFWEGRRGVRSPLPLGSVGSLLSVVGPEGGFCEEEIELAIDAGFEIAGLGHNILRADTAAVVATCISQLLLGDLGTVEIPGRTSVRP